MTQVHIDVTSSQHKAIKMLASMNNQSIKEYILEKALPEEEINFKEETIQAIKDSRENKNLSKAKDVKDLSLKLFD